MNELLSSTSPSKYCSILFPSFVKLLEKEVCLGFPPSHSAGPTLPRVQEVLSPPSLTPTHLCMDPKSCPVCLLSGPQISLPSPSFSPFNPDDALLGLTASPHSSPPCCQSRSVKAKSNLLIPAENLHRLPCTSQCGPDSLPWTTGAPHYLLCLSL